jgi:hypothetical protein
MASTEEECARQNFPYIGHGEVDVDFLVFGSFREVNFVGFRKYMTTRLKVTASLCMTTAKKED